MRSILSPRDRRRRCVARRVAEDEKESRSEKNKLAEEWENFWFGEYWNQEIPVEVSLTTILGLLALIYGIEYGLAEFFRSSR